MAGNHSEADVFAIPDFWKTSRWLTQLASETSASLIDPDLKRKALIDVLFPFICY